MEKYINKYTLPPYHMDKKVYVKYTNGVENVGNANRIKAVTTVTVSEEFRKWCKERGISMSDALSRGVRALQAAELSGEDTSVDYLHEKIAKLSSRLTEQAMRGHDQDAVIKELTERIAIVEASKKALR